MIYEVVAVGSAIISAGAVGMLWGVMRENRASKAAYKQENLFSREMFKDQYLAARLTATEEITTFKVQNDLLRSEARKQMAEFGDMMNKASQSNESLGSMCKDLERKLIVMDERIASLTGTATQPGVGNSNSWQTGNRP